MTLSSNQSSKLSDADLIRRAARSYIRQFNATNESLKADAGVELDNSSFNRWISGSTKVPGEINKIADYLVLKDFLVEAPHRHYYETISDFFSTQSGRYTQELLRSVEGHYACFQPSTWHPGLVTISHVNIKPLLDPEALYRDVVEEQFTGDSSQCRLIGSFVNKEIDQERESFRGCCYVCHEHLNFTLRSVRHGFSKSIICNAIDDDHAYMSGFVQKSTQNRMGNYIHMESLYFERVKGAEYVNPRIELLDRIDNERALRAISRPIGLAARGKLKL